MCTCSQKENVTPRAKVPQACPCSFSRLPFYSRSNHIPKFDVTTVFVPIWYVHSGYRLCWSHRYRGKDAEAAVPPAVLWRCHFIKMEKTLIMCQTQVLRGCRGGSSGGMRTGWLSSWVCLAWQMVSVWQMWN